MNYGTPSPSLVPRLVQASMNYDVQQQGYHIPFLRVARERFAAKPTQAPAIGA